MRMKKGKRHELISSTSICSSAFLEWMCFWAGHLLVDFMQGTSNTSYLLKSSWYTVFCASMILHPAFDTNICRDLYIDNIFWNLVLIGNFTVRAAKHLREACMRGIITVTSIELIKCARSHAEIHFPVSKRVIIEITFYNQWINSI